jgi:hypothetical protein
MRTLAALALAVVSAACSSDPCKAAERYANTCASQFSDAGATVSVTANSEQCKVITQKCTPAEQAELAGFYDCLASKNECAVGILTSSCTANVKLSTVTCTLRGCSGSPLPCSFINEMAKCTAAAGCSWAATRCSGTRTQTSCSATDQAACTAVEGCVWNN